MTRGRTRDALGTLRRGAGELLAVRWVRVVVVLVVLVIGVRVGLTALLGNAVNRLAARNDLVCGWEDLDLALLSGRGEVHFLSVRPRGDEAADALVEVEYGVFDLAILPLFRGELRIRRAEIDGLDARLEREADGTWNLERHVDVARVLALLQEEGAGPEPAPSADPEPPAPIDLRPPLAIEALRLQHARLHLVDRAVEPPFRTVLEASARLSSLATSDRPARFSLTLTGTDVIDGATLEGEARWSEDALAVELDAQAGGFHPGRLATYLALLDVRPACHEIGARLRAAIDVAVVGERRDTIAASLTISDASLHADGTELFALERLDLEVAELGPERTTLPRIALVGPRGRAALEPDGALALAGFALLPGAEAHAGAGSPAWADALADALALAAPESWPAWLSLLAHDDPGAYPWTLGELGVERGELALTDGTVDPPTELVLAVDRVALKGIAHDPAQAARPIDVSGLLRAPGLARTLRIDGALRPFAPERSIELELAVDGIDPVAADPYLRRAGVEPALADGTLHAALVGSATTDAEGRTVGAIELREVALREGDEVFGVRSVAARGLELDPVAHRIRLGELEIAGPELSFVREASRSFAAFGLRTLGRAALQGSDGADAATPEPARAGEAPIAASAASSTAGTAGTKPPRLPLVLEVGRLAWTDSRIGFVDRSTEPPTTFALDELGFELLGLTLGGRAGDPVPEPARLTGSLRSEGIVGGLVVEGAIVSRPGPLDLEVELALRGEDLSGARLEPYLAELGVEPTLAAGRASLDARLELAERGDGGWRVALELANGELSDGGVRLASLGGLALAAELGGSGAVVETLEVVEPYARIERDAGGAWRAAGLRTVAVVAEEAPAVAGNGDPAGAAAPALELPSLPPLAVKRIALERARLELVDLAHEPALAAELVVDAVVNGFATDGSTATFDVRASLPGEIERANVDGAIALGPDGWSVGARFSAGGFTAGPATALARGFLPSGVELATAGASLAGSLDARVAPAPDGGLALALGADDVAWGPEGADVPWLGCRALRVEVPRLDPAAGVVALGALRVEGARVAVERDAEGGVHALGLRVGPGTGAAPAPVAAPAVTSAVTSAEPVAQHGTGAPPAGGPAARPPRLPRIELAQGASFELERFVVRDALLGADARPLAGRVSFALEGPCTLVDDEPQALPPLAWRVDGDVEGLVGRWSVAGSIAPLAEEPTLEASLDAAGIRTAGLVELVPALGSRLAGELEDGRASGTLRTTLFVRRAHPTDLGLARPFSAELELVDLAFTNGAGGARLAGLDRIGVDVKRIDPARGLVHVESVVIRRPQAALSRDADGVHAFGIALATAAAEGAGEVPVAPDETPVAAGAPATAEPGTGAGSAPGEGAGEVRIDEIVVSGIDVVLRDETGEPPLVVALDRLDAEVERFTTRAFSEKRTIAFGLRLGASPVRSVAPDARPGSSPDRGVAIEASAAQPSLPREPVPGDGAVPAFEELEVAGRVAPWPAPSGWVQVQLVGAELASLSGLAAREGLRLEDGVLDAGVRVRMRDARASVGSSFTFTDLSMSEAEGGPIERLFSLPMSLDAALFLLRNQDGEHRMSIAFDVDEGGGLSTAQLAGAATAAMAEVLARALAAAPLRVLGGIVPGSKEKDEPRVRETLELAFAPGSTELAPADATRLADLARRLEGRRSLSVIVRHAASAGDAARAEDLANPDERECLEICAGLRQRGAVLDRRIDELAKHARAAYAVGAGDARSATEELRALAAERASVADALDRVLEVMRRGDSERQRAKRTRSALREIAALRLAAAEASLRADGDRLGARLTLRPARNEPIEALRDAAAGGRVVIEVVDR